MERLSIIFPLGTPNRAFCIREQAASTIFVMLYIGAVEGSGTYLGPVHIYRMTHDQAALASDDDRRVYKMSTLKKGFSPTGQRWYADNTRESIRDETIRQGLVPIGAIIQLTDMATTSSKPRYALKKDFAKLFDPRLESSPLENMIGFWQSTNLSQSALMKLKLASLGSTNASSVLVTFPNKETRILPPGPSSEISKHVIEVFAQKFMRTPALIWLSTSSNKVVTRDDQIATSIGLKIEADKNLPDIIMADLGPADPLLIFIEVVATDGAITEGRQKAIYQIAENINPSQIVFVTAYLDRNSTGFKKTINNVAWNSFVWFVSEPDKIVQFKNYSSLLSDLIG
jgi:hypothetical protein